MRHLLNKIFIRALSNSQNNAHKGANKTIIPGKYLADLVKNPELVELEKILQKEEEARKAEHISTSRDESKEKPPTIVENTGIAKPLSQGKENDGKGPTV